MKRCPFGVNLPISTALFQCQPEFFALQEKLCKDIDERSVYAKPLPFDCTLEGLTSFFSAYGGVKAVRLRRRPDNKDFKGSCFVELDSPDAANKVQRI